ncbi:hypothetical protein LIER_21701 [Lithospermum erythrorhizon]|uniref:Aminotransferase-like plant mobile domain-containing protein n=1 Tax=Lithospermum erythrorhizon TaxID=34254 RepID=A0AAV3QUB6_LITER
MSIDWDSVLDSEVEGLMDWSPYASRSCYYLTSHGNPEPKAPRTLWCSPIFSMAGLEEAVQASLYVYDCSDAVMKAFCECLSRALLDKDRIPESCAFLLQAYHCLSLSSTDGHVLNTDWINHWSESSQIYVGPQDVGASRGKISSLAGCPKETILPHEPHGYMRASVFKMASWVIKEYGGLSRSRPCDSVVEARGRLDNGHPGWTTLKPRWSAFFVFYDHKPKSYEEVTFFLSLRTNMVGFHFGDQFDVEVYHPHRFSRRLGFAPSIPGIRNEIRAIVDVVAGFRLWRICTIFRVGQRVRFPTFKDSTSRSKEYQAWLDTVLSNSIKLACGSGGIYTEVVDTGESHAETDAFTLRFSSEAALIPKDGTSLGAASVEEHPICMATKVVDTTTSAPASVHHIESIFRDSLRAAWDLFCHGKKLKAIFSKAPLIKKVHGKANSSRIHDKFTATKASTEDFSSKLLHKKEVVGKVSVTLRQSEDRASRLSLEVEKTESALQVASLEEVIEKGKGERLEQLSIELESLYIDLKVLF